MPSGAGKPARRFRTSPKLVLERRALAQRLSQLSRALGIVLEIEIDVDGHHHRAWRLQHGAQDGERADDHVVGVPNPRLGLDQQRMKLLAVQRNSRIRKENGVFCIIPVARRAEASSTRALKTSLSPEATTPDQKRM